MPQHHLGQGLVISWDGATLEYSHKGSAQHYFSDIHTRDIVGLTEGEFLAQHAEGTIRVIDATSTPTRLEVPDDNAGSVGLALPALSKKLEATLERRLTYVIGIRNRGITQGQRTLLKRAAAEIAAEREEPPEAAPSPATLNRWIAAYQKNRREVASLLPGYARRKTANRLEPESEAELNATIEHSILELGLKNGKAYREYERRIKALNVTRKAQGLPPLFAASYSTFGRRVAAKNAFDVYAARHGIEEARRAFRMSRGHLPADFPLQYAEIDHTQLDLYVIDDLLFLPLGLPWITIVRDRFSGVILGLYVSFRKTSLESIFGAIRHSLFAHDRVKSIWPEIETPWPAYGFAGCYVSDRGADFLSPRYYLTLHKLGADTERCERATPWHKGPIERFILTLHRALVESLPGHTFPFRKAPYGYDARKHGVIRFSTLCFLLHKWICDDYHVTAPARNLARPIDRWNDGISVVEPPIPPSTHDLDVSMGVLHHGSLSQEGLRYQWLQYANDELRDLQRVIGLRTRVPFVVTEQNMGLIHVINPRTDEHFAVPSLATKYAPGRTLFQHGYIRRELGARLNASNAEHAEELLLGTLATIQETIGNSILQKDTADKARLWQAARFAQINSNDVLMGRPASILDAIKPPSAGASSTVGVEPRPGSNPQPKPSFTDIPTFSWAA